jgi:hypothetical protein
MCRRPFGVTRAIIYHDQNIWRIMSSPLSDVSGAEGTPGTDGDCPSDAGTSPPLSADAPSIGISDLTVRGFSIYGCLTDTIGINLSPLIDSRHLAVIRVILDLICRVQRRFPNARLNLSSLSHNDIIVFYIHSRGWNWLRHCHKAYG